MLEKIKTVAVRQVLHKEENEGFSLIELVVVVAVLAILAGIASSSFNRFRITVDENEANSEMIPNPNIAYLTFNGK